MLSRAYRSVRQSPALLATLFFCVATLVLAHWVSFGIATYHRTRATRSVRVDEADAAHEHGAALHESVHPSAGCVAAGLGSGRDGRQGSDSHCLALTADGLQFPDSEFVPVVSESTISATPAFRGFASTLRAPPASS